MYYNDVYKFGGDKYEALNGNIEIFKDFCRKAGVGENQYTQAYSTMLRGRSQDSGVTGAAKFVTSTVGNVAGGVGRTTGNVVGAAGRGLGDTITSATGSSGKPVGDALGSVGTGIQNGAEGVSKGVENAGQWKR
ncbi:hypothetical protein F4804DRAFT_333833 [Jackrogersella minutella]|nr:hypothetical protein F4804DRAFT_333833 [Jackrogersella minutella]